MKRPGSEGYGVWPAFRVFRHLPDAGSAHAALERERGRRGGGAERLGQEGLAPVEQRADLWARLDSDGYESAGLLHTRLQAIGLSAREIRVRAPSLHHLFSRVTDGKAAG